MLQLVNLHFTKPQTLYCYRQSARAPNLCVYALFFKEIPTVWLTLEREHKLESCVDFNRQTLDNRQYYH